MRIKLSVFIAIAAIAMVIAGCSQAAAPVATATAVPTPTPEKSFVSQEGRFSVMLPEDPTEKVQTLPTDAGDIEAHFLSVEQENAVYMIVYSDYPHDVVAQSDPETMLNGARDGAISPDALEDALAPLNLSLRGDTEIPAGRDIIKISNLTVSALPTVFSSKI